MSDWNNAFGSVDWTGTMSAVGTVITWVLVASVIVGLLMLVWYFMSFKNTLIVRQIVNGRVIIKSFKWKIVRDKKGIRWLQTPFHKMLRGLKRSLPKSDALDITSKGRFHAEAWYDSEGDNLIWVTDHFNIEKHLEQYIVEEDSVDPLTGENIVTRKLSKEYATKFQPLDTNDRELLVSEIMRAEEYRVKNKLQVLLQIAMYMVPIIMVVVIAMTIGEVTEALGGYVGPVSQAATDIADSLEKASMHINNAQDFTGEEIPSGGAPN